MLWEAEIEQVTHIGVIGSTGNMVALEHSSGSRVALG